jgi:hypothetical protein
MRSHANLQGMALTNADIETLLAYARRKYAEERWPLSPELRPVREALAKLDANSASAPQPTPKSHAPATIGRPKRSLRSRHWDHTSSPQVTLLHAVSKRQQSKTALRKGRLIRH